MKHRPSLHLLAALLMFSPLAFGAVTLPGGVFTVSSEDVEVGYEAHPLSRTPGAAQDAPPPRKYIQMGCVRYPVTETEGVMLSASVGQQWTDGRVYYVFDPAVSAQNRLRFQEAAIEWAQVADLTFIEGEGEGNYIYVVNSDQNYSYMGMIGGAQELGMYNWSYPGIIMHEIGHALSLAHEHQRSDRDEYVEILWDNIVPFAEGQFIILPTEDYGDYDFESIMHYPKDAFGWFGNTIIPKPPYSQYLNVMGQRNGLSDLDQEGMAHLYGAPRLIRYESHVLDDDNTISNGNGNGVPDPGESIEMPITLYNGNIDPYPAATATLSTEDPYISMIVSQQTVANLGPQSSKETQPFRFTIDPQCPEGHVVSFDLRIQSAGESWLNTFSIVVAGIQTGSSLLEFTGVVIHDGSGGGSGNKDGKINSGESIDLDVRLHNTGGTEVGNIRTTLTTTSPHVTVTDDYEVFSALAAGETGVSRSDFDFDVAANAPNGHLIEFDLTVTSDSGDWTFPFTLPVHGRPQLAFSAHTLFDGIDRQGVGNGDRKPDPGEDIDLYIDITNSGLGLSTESRTVLSTNSPYVTLTDTVERHSGMPPGGVTRSGGDYEFLISPSTPQNAALEFTLTMATDEGTYTDTFMLYVPGDPIIPTVSRMTLSGNTMQMEWSSEPGMSYRIWSKTSLADPTWTLVDTVESTQELTSFSFTEDQDEVYYRIERYDP